MTVVCAFDLGFRNDASAAAIVRRFEGRYTLIGHMEQRPRKGSPLVPGAVLAAVASLCKRYGCEQAFGDGHYGETSKEELGRQGIRFTLAPAGQPGKLMVWGKTKELILEGKVTTPPLSQLIAQLKLVRSKALSGGGVSIEQPRKAGSHGDLAAAFALALWAASQVVEWPKGALYTAAPDPRHMNEGEMSRAEMYDRFAGRDWDDENE